MRTHVIDTDVLIIGGGAAACRAALEASRSGARVVMVMKGALGRSGTSAYKIAEIAGYNVADGEVDPNDSPAEHLKDILAAAAGMCDERLASLLVHEAHATLRDLEAWGVPLVRGGDHYLEVVGCFATRPRMHIMPGHAVPMVNALVAQLRQTETRIVENTMVTRILVHEGRCTGATGITLDGEMILFRAGAVAMGTGGAGQLFLNNLNPSDITGDGCALALEAGAELVNMEFMQAGPAITSPVTSNLNCWVWKLHPKVYNAHGEEFLPRYMPPGMTPEECMDLQSTHYPFSVSDGSHWLYVALQKEILASRGTGEGVIFVDFRESSEDALPPTRQGEEIRKMWKMTKRWLIGQYGIDPSREPLRVACMGHAINGGMRITDTTETTIRGLFAAGEAAGGPHGADRLGGNMLVGCQVFGKRMGQYAASLALSAVPHGSIDTAAQEEQHRLVSLLSRRGKAKPSELKKLLQQSMWKGLLIVRNEEKLTTCLAELAEIQTAWNSDMEVGEPRELWAALEVKNMLVTADVMVRSALARRESRGSHYREDYPQRDDACWEKSIVTRWVDGRMEQYTTRLGRREGE